MNLRTTFEQALAHHKSGKLDEAERLYRLIVEGTPGIGNDLKPYADAIHYLGILIVAKGQLDEALRLMEHSLKLRPREAEYHRNYAVTLINGGRPQDMERGYRSAKTALPSWPDDVVLLELFGRAAVAVGHKLEAAQAWARLADLMPNNNAARRNAGLLFHQSGHFEPAIEAYRKVLRADPRDWVAMNNLASVLGSMRSPIESYDLLERLAAAERMDDVLQPLHAYFLMMNGQISRGEEVLAKVPVVERPDPGTTAHTFALLTLPYIEAAYLGAGHLQKSIEISAKYCALMPADVHGLARHASSAQYAFPDDPAAHLALHARFDRDIASTVEVLPPVVIKPLAGRRLRIGYVSGDFRAHSVGSFIEPLILHHDKARVEVQLFNNSAAMDAMSARLKAKADRWHDCMFLSDADLTRLVRSSAIDVLVDLSGHTGGARLKVFAARPAPVQVSYLGYSSTTGLTSMDGFITDPVCDPPGNDAHFTERLLRLPHVLGVFKPAPGMPAVSSPPAAQLGHVTLGSVAALRKINDAVLDAWAIGMRAAPTARLLIIGTGFGDATIQSRFRASFGARGVDAERISFIGYVPMDRYLQLHAHIDLMLDTFPFTGHTTTVQNLWMGVPVVTYAGISHRARMAASVLKSIGLDELIAHREEDYGPLIGRWAGDVLRLAELRAGMRERMVASPLMDERGFARDFDDLLINAYETKRETGHV